MVKLNNFVLCNMLCIAFFIASLFGLGDWAIASVVLIIGVSLSVFFGTFTYSKFFMRNHICRMVFSFGAVSTGYCFLIVGEFLNVYVYDGLVTLAILVYILFATALLHYMGIKSVANPDFSPSPSLDINSNKT